MEFCSALPLPCVHLQLTTQRRGTRKPTSQKGSATVGCGRASPCGGHSKEKAEKDSCLVASSQAWALLDEKD